MTHSAKQDFGDFVAEHRRATGLTQRELASRLHVTKPALFLKTERFDELAAALRAAQTRIASVEDVGFARLLKFSDPSDNFLGAIEFADGAE